MTDDDPFSVFGDDEDEDEPETSLQAQQLKEAANQLMLEQRTSAQKIEDATDDDGVKNITDLSTLTKPLSFSWDAPLYLGPLICVSLMECGGGRGYVATRDLQPGTLVIVEQPIVEWSEEQIGKELGLVSVLHILELDLAQKIVHDLEDFHPSKEDVNEFKQGDKQVREMIENLERRLSDELPTFVELAQIRGLSNRNGTPLNARDLVRILLSLRYNGFESGVYLYLAMLNHDSYPNCVKFSATKSYSEVRTTRSVRAGEPLTISYLPTIMCHASRRHHLWEQHLFDISGAVPKNFEAVENVGGSIPASTLELKDDTVITFRIENATAELSSHFRDAAAMVALDNRQESPVWEEAKALEVASLELYEEAKEQLQNDRHILLIPCLRLHLDVCDLIQIGKVLNANQHVMLLLRVVTSSLKLIELQAILYSKDHFDLAQTYNELSQAVSELLLISPKQIIGLGLEGMKSPTACSSAAYKAKREFERIRELYPHNAEQHIRK